MIKDKLFWFPIGIILLVIIAILISDRINIARDTLEVHFRVLQYKITHNDDGSANVQIEIEYLRPNEWDLRNFAVHLKEVPIEMVRRDMKRGDEFSFKFLFSTSLFSDGDVPEEKLWRILLKNPSAGVAAMADLLATADIMSHTWRAE